MTITPTLELAAKTANSVDVGPTGNDQTHANVLSLADGRFVVFWTDNSNAESGAVPGLDILAQVYDASGVAIGSVQRINLTNTQDNERNFSVALLPGDRFVVAYEDSNANGVSVRAEEFTIATDSSFTHDVGLTILQNPGGGDVLSFPKVTARTDGTYMVSYARTTAGTDMDVFGKIVTGGVVGAELTVFSGSDDTPGVDHIATATLANGNFVIISEDQIVPDGDRGLFLRILNSAGGNVLAQTNLGGTSGDTASQQDPSVTALTGGGFVVSWLESDGTDTDIIFQVFNAAGATVAGPFGVNDLGAAENNNESAVVALKDGGFFVVYDDDTVDAIKGQRYDASGTAVGSTVTIANTTGTEDAPRAQLTDDGRIIVSWTVAVSGNSDVKVAVYDPRTGAYIGEDDGRVIYGRADGDGPSDDFAIFGGLGDDTIIGRGSDDIMSGGGGADTLTGGSGADRFDYDLIGDIAATGETIADFDFSDLIDLSTIDQSTPLTFIGTAAFSNVAGQMRYRFVGGTTEIQIDVNGDGAVDRTITVTNGQFAIDETAAGSAILKMLSAPPTPGNDSLAGGAGNDTIDGLAGNDTIHANDGDDVLIGGAGADSLNGGNGFDTASYAASATAVTVNLLTGFGSGGDAVGDLLVGIDHVTGSAFNDSLTGDNFNNDLIGGNGDDTLRGNDGDDRLFAGIGKDLVVGGVGNDFSQTSNGNDTAFGGDGNDTLGAGAGQDQLRGELGDDQLLASNGNDFIFGGDGNDLMLGGAGRDTLWGDAGADTLNGGTEIDTASYDTATSGVAASLNTGLGTVGDALGDVFVGIEGFRGSGSADTLEGDAFANRFDAGAGNDSLDGLAGSDTLLGETGADTMTGGADNDQFWFFKGYGADVITDFTAGAGLEDVIRIFGRGAAVDTLAEVLALSTQVGADVVINFGAGDTITLQNVTLASLNANDFIFG
ncbi:MAG: hypothetical protein A3E78_17310 [Alphaproteobacteria bacterium RIFCSPHIGHO2_12_FULL_63_12]|nr:MAG: hypothetical protein A3E78_17310 [Alphaproteobacteria bacterium RIFCSPHIGHO2_12_FULL_63_12]